MQFLSLKSAGMEDLSSKVSRLFGNQVDGKYLLVGKKEDLGGLWSFVMGLSLHAHLETPSLGLKDRYPVWPSPAPSVIYPVPLLSITCPITLTDFIFSHVPDIFSSGSFHRLLLLPCLPSSLTPFTWLKPPNLLALCFFVIFSVMSLLDMPLIGSDGLLGASLHSIGWFIAKWAFVCVGF